MICQLVLFYIFWLNICLIVTILILIFNWQVLIFLNYFTKTLVSVIFDIFFGLESYKGHLLNNFLVINAYHIIP